MGEENNLHTSLDVLEHVLPNVLEQPEDDANLKPALDPITLPDLPAGAFKPTPEQSAYMLVMLNPSKGSVKAELKKLGISKNKTILWHKDKGFNDWFYRNVEEFMGSELVHVYKTLFNQAAIKGNIPAIKLFMERFDRAYQEFLGKIDLSIRAPAAPVSPEEMAKAVVKQIKTDPVFKDKLRKELELEEELAEKEYLN